MYEHNTKEAILKRMLDAIPDDMDKREGSVIFDALSPAAVELSFAYISLDEVLRETFGDTAGRGMLIKRAAERGIIPYPAVAAEYRCETNVEIPIGTRFTAGDLFFAVTDSEGENIYRLRCETPGEIGNAVSGKLIPVEYIEGFESISIISRSVAGEDDEETEHLRKRFLTSYETSYFGGNMLDYKTKVNSIENVGGCKIYPAWNGGGTVKIVICDKAYHEPSAALVDTVQELIDPPLKTGEGFGIAPIGHKVSVFAAEGVTIDIGTQLIAESGWVFGDIKPLAEAEIDSYLHELGAAWQDSEALVVRISQIESRLLNIPHVVDVRNTVINGNAENFILEADSVPQKGDIYEL